MQVAVRSYLTAGVALIGAGAIVAAPITPSPPDIQVPAIYSANVELAASTGPIEQWINVFASAFNNVAQIGAAVAADPAPVLRQMLINQLGYGQTLVTGLQGTTEGFLTWATENLPQTLQTMASDISQGNIVGAADAFNELLGSLLFVGFPLFNVLTIPGQITDNLTNAVKALTSLGTLLPVVVGILGPMEGVVSAMGDSGQAFVNAIGAGNPIAALTALINIPAAFTGALLNGYTSVAGNVFPGLLTVDPVNGGLLQALFVTIPQAIAAAITPAPVPVAARTMAATSADIAAIPEATAAIVSLEEPATPAVEAEPAGEPTTEAVATTTTDAEEETDASTEPEATVEDDPRTDTKDGNKAVPGEVDTDVTGSGTTTTPTTSEPTTTAGDPDPTEPADETDDTTDAGATDAGSEAGDGGGGNA